jgi:hypothetical protein
VTNGIAGLYMRPRDLAKFGILYLDRGKWGEQQVLPAEWVDESTREQAYIGPDDYLGGIDRRFGYMWSIFPEQGYYGFMGMAGQELFVIPEKNMVVVFTGGLEVGKEASLLKLVNTYILPAATSVKALSPDPESNARLDLLTQAAAGSARPIPPLPQAALELSGKTFRLDPNPLDWEDITFSFSANSDEAALKVSGQTWLAIGLDGRYRLTDQVDSRPAGLRGRWRNSEEFELDHILLGEFVESSARIVFSGEQLTMFIKSHNYGGPELVIKGASIP